MKIIKHWWVKLYQHSQQSPLMSIVSNGASGGNGSLSRLIAEGYSADRILLPHRDGSITLLTNLSGGELKTFRADVVDSIVCTPVYEDEDKTDLNPPRFEMLEYIKTAIGEGYRPEHEDAVSDLSVIDDLNDSDLNREFGKCWQWYNMGGGLHEAYAPKDDAKAELSAAKGRYNYDTFKAAAKPLIQWLNENANPHASITVEVDGATLYTGEIHAPVREFIKD